MSYLLPGLADHVRNAVEKCGALGGSVYVPTPWNPAAPGVLLHVGGGEPLPEMATPEGARVFANEAAATPMRLSGATVAVLSSTAPDGCLVPIPLLTVLWHGASTTAGGAADAPGQQRRLADRHGGPPIVGWLGLRFAEPPGQPPYASTWQSLLELASTLASTYVCSYGILTDPVTGLPGRAELEGTLRAELERAQSNGLPFSLLFVKLEELDRVNQRHGRRAGDAVLAEFLDEMQGAIRRTDTVMRYGGAVFALPLRDVTSSGALVVGEKILRRVADRRFLDHALRLPCAVGVASIDGAVEVSLQPLDLLRRADQALLAAQRGGCSEVVLWRADGALATVEHLDPLLGVFTGQTEKDYRNMRMLWEVMQALSSTSGSELARAVVARVFSLAAATRAALFEPAGGGGLTLTAGQQRLAGSGESAMLSGDDIQPHEWRLNEEAVTSLTPLRRHLELTPLADGSTSLTALAVPLVIDGRALGTLYLSGGVETLKVDATDLPLLCGVAAQLALAFDRERLTEQQRIREQRERLLLRGEVDRLRTVLKREQFVFRSKPMADLLNTVRRVATTDATVLVTGESGTGKEMLANTLHQISERRARPLVVVDCGAIPASLMDSELFGRERGAYTGAERRAGGRLAGADGGTVFLDEIGELPLEVQAKLLRFVQEKTITMVGTTRAQKVDVRIIAATNRSLEDEVRAGRFREDLFHRLNVVRVRVPPLRERPDDVLFLARHFLEAFAGQYAKGLRGLDGAAERLLETHDWPGNVRELQNTILQAVVLAEGDVVTAGDLRLPETTRRAPSDSASARPDASRGLAGSAPSQVRAPADDSEAVPTFEDARQALADRLTAEIAAVGSSGARLCPPLGKWLARDLVLAAHEWAGGVAARAATCLGLPETTFSRHLRQAQVEATSTRKSDSWASVQSALSDLLRASGRPPRSLVDDIDELFFRLVLAQVPNDVARTAGLMGVSPPTMKRRLNECRQTGGTPVEGTLVA